MELAALDRDGLSRLIAAGRGDAPAQMVLRGGTVLDVVTGAMIEGDVAIVEGRIAGIGAHYEGGEVIDMGGGVLVPGFIDTHLHIESSMVTPHEFDRCVGPRGITTAICDPHEIANVLGVPGITYFLEAARHTLMSIKVNLPSCVPSSHMETSGARIGAAELAALAAHPSALGLAEFMNYPGVVSGAADCLDKLAAFSGAHIDGHAPQLSGKGLNAYVAAGIRTEHEATRAEEALEKLSRGMRILIREGSVSKDLDALLPILTERNSAYLCLCTDDRNPLDIGEHGHLDYMIRHAIAKGASPLAVYRAATLSAAEAFGLKDRGQIAPGKRADIVVLGSLEACDARMVLSGGRRLDEAAFAARAPVAPIGRNSMKAPHLASSDFASRSNQAMTDVIGILPGKIITEHLREEIVVSDGDKRPDPARDLARIAVIERHGHNGNIARGFVRGFGLERGAIASSICHDHHNIVCAGVDYADMALAANRLGEIEGGIVVACEGEIRAELALPVAGLMSLAPFEQVRGELEALRHAARALGVVLEEPFLQLAFLALPVIPALKITDRGMVDVTRFEIIG
ncbi:adenine deaminase [Profundibacterium mesophilum]|uniref:Adenine deaminase n=1 Tax=Profundibacterium mesophilum KAUST100406-0324 TaxID=1037889 RepID=A0A921NQ95_9RHOB|nr:adenine deaminase [Profundibacterium mesophilum]KAF0675365.1 Adenine deaminase [Profundibacterium mesophilum KAUST100406-0324]